MTEKEMIEEMAKCYCDYCMAQTGEKKCENQADKRCSVFWDCEFFYNAGYRKIPEGAVVLTGEEFDTQTAAECAIERTMIAKAFAERLLNFIRYETFREGYELKKIESWVKEFAEQHGAEVE